MSATYIEILRAWGCTVKEEDLFVPLSAREPGPISVQYFFECPHALTEDTNYANAKFSSGGHRIIYWDLCYVTHAPLLGETEDAKKASQDAFFLGLLAEFMNAVELQARHEVMKLGLKPGIEEYAKDHIAPNSASSYFAHIELVAKKFGLEDLRLAVSKRRLEIFAEDAPALEEFMYKAFNLKPLRKTSRTAYVHFKHATKILAELLTILYPSVMVKEAGMTEEALGGRQEEPPVLFHEIPIDNLNLNLSPEGLNTIIDAGSVRLQEGVSRSAASALSSRTQFSPYLDKAYAKPKAGPGFNETLGVLAKEMNFEDAIKAAKALES